MTVFGPFFRDEYEGNWTVGDPTPPASEEATPDQPAQSDDGSRGRWVVSGPCEACDGRGWVHGECNYRPGGSERCQGWMDMLGYSKCAEPWPCPLCAAPGPGRERPS